MLSSPWLTPTHASVPTGTPSRLPLLHLQINLGASQRISGPSAPPSECFLLGCNLPLVCLPSWIIKSRTGLTLVIAVSPTPRMELAQQEVKREPQLNSSGRGDPKSPGKTVPQKTPLSTKQKRIFSTIYQVDFCRDLHGLLAVTAIVPVGSDHFSGCET